MKRLEFNKLVNETKKNLLKRDAHEIFCRLKTLNMYRHYGIEGCSLDEILTEIAQAEILNMDFVDNIDIEEEIKHI
jgi:hypothetical protein